MINIQFKQRIKDVCNEKGITQKEMLKKLELGNSYMTQADNPRADKMILIADYLDVSIDYLLGRTNNPKSHKL